MKYDFRPLSEEVYTITHASGERFEGEMWLGKGSAGPPLHIHPHLEEDLHLISGKLEIYRNGRWEVIEADTSWRIPPGEVHTFKGVPDSEATVRFSVTPCMGFEGFLSDTQQLVEAGKLTSYESLNGLIYSSMLVMKYKDTMVAAQPAMRMIMSVAAFIGRLLGRRV